MFTSNVIDSSPIFLARRQYKLSSPPERQWVKWDAIKTKQPGKMKPTKYQIGIYLRFLNEYAIARSIVVDEEGFIIAGEAHYRAIKGSEPWNVPVYILPGLSGAHKAAFRHAYGVRGSL